MEYCNRGGCNSKALLDAQYEIKALMNNFECVGKLGNFEVNWSDLMKLNKNVLNMFKYLYGKFKEYGLGIAHLKSS